MIVDMPACNAELFLLFRKRIAIRPPLIRSQRSRLPILRVWAYRSFGYDDDGLQGRDLVFAFEVILVLGID